MTGKIILVLAMGTCCLVGMFIPRFFLEVYGGVAVILSIGLAITAPPHSAFKRSLRRIFR